MGENANIPRIRVMLVDDSAVVRGMIARKLQEQPDIEVVASASDGAMAIESLKRTPDVDVIILDIEMPKKDGLAALPELLKIAPHAKVIMASTLTQRNASISMQALAAGAADYLPKPSSQDIAGKEGFYNELLHKVKTLGAAAHIGRGVAQRKQAIIQNMKAAIPASSVISKEILPNLPPKALAIASSTGGPQAIATLFKGLQGTYGRTPIFLTQHMPATFTALLAKNIATDGNRAAKEAVDGEKVAHDHTYVAPGDYHMRVVDEGTHVKVKLDQDPPINFCRPAADPMLESLAKIYRDRLLIVVLTGMGQDGLAGAQKATELGATVIAQDEASSVVWGMPGAVAKAGLCKAILPLEQIADYLKKAERAA